MIFPTRRITARQPVAGRLAAAGIARGLSRQPSALRSQRPQRTRKGPAFAWSWAREELPLHHLFRVGQSPVIVMGSVIARARQSLIALTDTEAHPTGTRR